MSSLMRTNLGTTAPEAPPCGEAKNLEEYPMSSLNQAVAPAGWYRDPLGLPQVRWWNGMSWTNRIEEIRPEIQVAPAQRQLISA